MGGSFAMRRNSWLAFSSLLALGYGAYAQTPAAEKKAIEQQNSRIIQALKDGSTKALLDVCTPDFTWKLSDGSTLSRRQGEVAFRQMLTSRHIVDISLKIVKLAPAGSDFDATMAAKE